MDPKDEYHTDIIRAKLTRDVAGTFKEVREELVMAMDDLIPTREDSKCKILGERLQLTGSAEWVKVPIPETLQRVICRATNRIFVGIPLCLWSHSGSSISSAACADFVLGRDHDYQTLNIAYAVNVQINGMIISLFPKPLKLYVLIFIHVPL